MKVAIASDFFTALAKLPKTQLDKTIRLVDKFKNDPTSSGLNYEKMHFSHDGSMHSIRVDLAYRCIVLKPQQGDVYIMLWVDHHDEAYEWAKRHRCSVHPETGTLQIIETEHVVETEVVQPIQNTDTFFSNFKDKDLLRLGVPENMLNDVKAIDHENDLDRMQSRLPEEAYEGLFYLLAGDDLQSVYGMIAAQEEDTTVDTEDFATALERDSSKRRFYVVDDNDIDLMSMMNAPLEKWRVFLHPTQRKLVNRDWNGPVRVLGGAGTGKTVAAMHRAKWLAQKALTENGKILFTTFTKNLAVDIQDNLRKICSREQMDKIEVVNLDQWVHEFLYKNGYQEKIVFSEEISKLWDNALLNKPASLELSDSFFKEEWERVVQPQSVTSLSDYIKASRIGRGTRLSRAQRKEVWEVFEEYRLLLAKNNYKEPSDAMRDARILIETGKAETAYQSVVVDEAQDFSAQAFMLLRALVPEGKNDLFIVGDAHQRIYGHKVVLGQCGIKIVGRSRKLKLNYRTTDEIRKWATRLFDNSIVDDLDDGNDTQKDYKSLYHGPEPEIKLFKTLQDELEFIKQHIEELSAEDPESRICLVLRTNNLAKQYKEQLKNQDIKVLELKKDTVDDPSKKGVRIATMHRVKGLDFDHVIIASVNDGVIPNNYAIASDESAIQDENIQQEKALLFVSATRSKKTLLITSNTTPSVFLSDLSK